MRWLRWQWRRERAREASVLKLDLAPFHDVAGVGKGKMKGMARASPYGMGMPMGVFNNGPNYDYGYGNSGYGSVNNFGMQQEA